jgi:hypothetical protein
VSNRLSHDYASWLVVATLNRRGFVAAVDACNSALLGDAVKTPQRGQQGQGILVADLVGCCKGVAAGERQAHVVRDRVLT